MKQAIGRPSPQRISISIQTPGIPVEILVRAELRWIDEYTHHHLIDMFSNRVHQV
jgi:hypothetical protein